MIIEIKMIKENRDEAIIPGELTFLFNPEKDQYESKKLLMSLKMIMFDMKNWR